MMQKLIYLSAMILCFSCKTNHRNYDKEIATAIDTLWAKGYPSETIFVFLNDSIRPINGMYYDGKFGEVVTTNRAHFQSKEKANHTSSFKLTYDSLGYNDLIAATEQSFVYNSSGDSDYIDTTLYLKGEYKLNDYWDSEHINRTPILLGWGGTSDDPNQGQSTFYLDSENVIQAITGCTFLNYRSDSLSKDIDTSIVSNK